MDKTISILHPSWGRPQLAKNCYNEWIDKADKKENIEYILCLSKKDPAVGQYTNYFSSDNISVLFLDDNGLVKQVNHAARSSVANLIIAVSDDFGCPANWDESLLSALKDKNDFVVKTQDGLQPWIMTLPMMDRAYYNRFNYIYHPAYDHMWGDTENTHVAGMLGKTINLPLVFPHRHYTTGINPRDSVNIQNDSTMLSGENVYLERLKTNFGIENPLSVQLPAHHIQFFRHKGIHI